MKVFPGNAQHIGSRKEQQDAFGFSDIADTGFISHGGVLAVVADGMGGLAEGGKSARLAVSTFLGAYSRKTEDESIDEALERSLQESNDAVYSLAVDMGQKDNMGTTLIAAVVNERTVYWVSAGDSRIYITDGQSLTQLTEDHVYGRKLEQAAEKGLIDREMVLSHPERESLTSYIGDASISEIDKGSLEPLSEEFTLLLCSDGLFKFFPENRIIAEYTEDPVAWTQNLVDAVIGEKIPAQDNVTVVCLRVGEPAQAVRKKTGRIRILATAVIVICFLIASGVWFYRNRTDVSSPTPSIIISDDISYGSPDIDGKEKPAEEINSETPSPDGVSDDIVSYDNVEKSKSADVTP